ncbi:MAG: DUF2617 family protein [Lacipirellulaceae bacterium]
MPAVLSVRPKIAELVFQLYGRTLHPELFEVCKAKRFERGGYTAVVSITGAGHVVEWRHQGLVLTEVAASAAQPLPIKRRLMSHRLAGEQTDGMECRGGVTYQTTFSLESATPDVLQAYRKEIDLAGLHGGLVHRFDSSGRIGVGALSYVDVQSRDRTFVVRALHTFPDDGVLMKARSVFQLPG